MMDIAWRVDWLTWAKTKVEQGGGRQVTLSGRSRTTILTVYCVGDPDKKKEEKKKYEPPPPPRTGRKKVKKGPDSNARLPTGSILFCLAG
eukprot:768344-Hanusia_phi.AAC.4